MFSRETLMSGTISWKNRGFGLYLHWPFCVTKCPYCDFNSFTGSFDADVWQKAYLSEIDRVHRLRPDGVLNTIYLGGGTPSLMPVRMVEAILSRIRERWRTVNDLEVTLEANPSSVEYAKFSGFRDAGVNRVSLGLQALDDDSLRALGRPHSATEGLRALEIAQKSFERVNADLIYARQDQTLRAWTSELSALLSTGVGHASLYQLTVEDGTIFARRAAAGKLLGLPTEDLSVEMFNLTQAMTEEVGLQAYEVSNHAKPGEESRHNLIYWHGGEFLGIGPGAHGRINLDGSRLATVGHLTPRMWLNAIDAQQVPEDSPHTLSDEEVCTETLLMGLRLTEGVATQAITELGFAIDQKTILDLSEQGLVRVCEEKLRVTPSGRLLLNTVTAELANSLRPM